MRVQPPRGRAYLDPRLAGVGVGLVLLASFVLMGRGLGASGGLTAVVAAMASSVAPDATIANPVLGPHLLEGSPLRDWLVFELIGVFVGAAVSARLAGRFGLGIRRGDGMSVSARLGAALAGGILMGVGAKFARGCTSGQALTGGALLGVGSWVFLLTAFAAGFVTMALVRRTWR